jgi:hypothetical protein
MAGQDENRELPPPTRKRGLAAFFERLNAEVATQKAADKAKAEARVAAQSAPEALARRQTVAAELSALSTFLFTAALVVVGVLQWQTSERAAKLSYALANPKFDVSVSKASDDSSADPSAGKSILHIRPVSGVYAITGVDVEQDIDLSLYEKGDAQKCGLRVSDYYQITGSFLDRRSTRAADKLSDIHDLNKNMPFGTVIVPTVHSVQVSTSFDDIFHDQKTQKFHWDGGLTYAVTDEKDDGRTEAKLSEDANGRLLLAWATGAKVSDACKAVAKALLAFGPAKHVVWQQHRTTKRYTDKDGNQIDEITTWKTPVPSE